MTERKFTEAEVAAIFERATTTQLSDPAYRARSEGMTLTQLQEIGKEVGIEPNLIAQAARALDGSERTSSRTFLGLPIGVARTVELNRKLSDDEWERLVVDLRETFDARGVVRSEGSLRQWTNGNLQVLLEPSDGGHRVRMRTVKGDVRVMFVGGMAMLGGAAVALTSALTRTGAIDLGAISALMVLAGMGAVMLGLGTLRLPAWARIRRQQMEAVANRITAPSKE